MNLEGDPDAWCDRTSLAKSFDFSRRCQRCGIGRKQVRPFRLRDSPRLTNQLMRLHWVPDEILVAYETWAATFRRLGVQCRPVVLEGSDEVIESVVQLEISERCGFEVEPGGFHGVRPLFAAAVDAVDGWIFSEARLHGRSGVQVKGIFRERRGPVQPGAFCFEGDVHHAEDRGRAGHGFLSLQTLTARWRQRFTRSGGPAWGL